MRRKSDNEMEVETYRGHRILLNRDTSKFFVQELAQLEGVDSLQAARSAIDKGHAELNKGVRRKVLFFGDTYYSDDTRKINEGELTSWTRPRGYRDRVEGVIMQGKDRQNMAADAIFEDTKTNRDLMARCVEIDKQVQALRKEQTTIIEKKLKQADIAAGFRKAGDEE